MRKPFPIGRFLIHLSQSFIMKRLLLLFVLLYSASLQAQVSGIGYTLSPTVEYARWNDKLGLENGYLYGGKLGMSFGEFVELSAVYLLGYDAQTDYSRFSQLTTAQRSVLALNNKAVDFKRYGGELRFNLSRSNFVPFITLGTGVQEITPEGNNTVESIYLNAGAGVSFSVYDRYLLSLYAKNTGLRINPRNLLSTQQQLSALVSPTQMSREDLQNWSLGGSLSLYLGGRRSGQLTDIDREVLNRFNGGFAGLSVPVEPQYGQLNFHDALPYRNTPFAGVNAGLDFGKLLGIRGFYWRGLKDELSTDLDDLQLYGAEMKFKLNEANGIVPYLTVGGGKIDAMSGYVGRGNGASLDDRPFATGGLGLIVPIGRYVQLFGGARALLMTTVNDPTNNLSSPDELKVSTAYSAGVNLTLGKKPTRSNIVRETDVEAARMAEAERLRLENTARLEALEAQYDAKLATLNNDLRTAIARGDSLIAYQKAQEIRETQTVKEQLHQVNQTQAAVARQETVIEKEIIQSPVEGRRENITIPVPQEGEIYIRYGKPSDVNVQTTVHQQGVSNTGLGANVNLLTPEQLKEMIRSAIREEMSKRDSVKVVVNTIQSSTPVAPQVTVTTPNAVVSPSADIQVQTEIVPAEETVTAKPRAKYKYESVSLIGGVSFPDLDNFHPTAGIRVPFRSPLKFFTLVPEVSYDFTDKKLNLGVFGIRPFLRKQSLKFRPYYGAGVAYQGFDTDTADTSNLKIALIGGGEFNLKNGLLFTDYTNYGLTNAHRVMLGYRLPF